MEGGREEKREGIGELQYNTDVSHVGEEAFRLVANSESQSQDAKTRTGAPLWGVEAQEQLSPCKKDGAEWSMARYSQTCPTDPSFLYPECVQQTNK